MSAETIQQLLGSHPVIWVFGYGSLLWKPDFAYKSKRIGFIRDFERRFYQGNTTFRGTQSQPGRVANLIAKKGSLVWGVAYEISGRDDVSQTLQGLYNRETTQGGYVTMVTTFYPRPQHQQQQQKHTIHVDPPSDNYHSSGNTKGSSEFANSRSDFIVTDENFAPNIPSLNPSFDVNNRNPLNSTSIANRAEINKDFLQTALKPTYSHKNETSSATSPFQVLLYTATPDNDLYLGAADVSSMARQIVKATGTAGTNIEYVIKIADYVRKHIPEEDDAHLFSLEAKVIEEVYKRRLLPTSGASHSNSAPQSHDMFDLGMERDLMSGTVLAA